jgi:hypothetical protein
LCRVKAEKKLLVKELRALRDLGLYEGPLTYSDIGPVKPHDTPPVAPVAALEREEVHESAVASSALPDEKPETEGGSCRGCWNRSRTGPGRVLRRLLQRGAG